MTLAELYHKLRTNPSGHAFTVAQLSSWDDIYLAVDKVDHPCLFVKADEKSFDAPLRTSHVLLQLGQEYSLALGSSQPTRQLFHALFCQSQEKADVDTFLVLLSAFLASSKGKSVTANTLSSFFRSLLRLFAVTPSTDTSLERQGLWGELFAMSRVRGFAFWAPYWHNETTQRFDFSGSGRHVEVKTTTGTERIHHFSHRQVYSREGEEIVIASLMIRESESGLSLRDLIIDCRAALLDTPFYLKLEKAVRSAKMHDTSEPGPTFDTGEAERTLAWFRAEDAPHFRVPEPPGVTETRYRVDLSIAPQLERQELDAWLNTWPKISPELALTQI